MRHLIPVSGNRRLANQQQRDTRRAYLGIIHRKINVLASLCPMFLKPEKASFNPDASAIVSLYPRRLL